MTRFPKLLKRDVCSPCLTGNFRRVHAIGGYGTEWNFVRQGFPVLAAVLLIASNSLIF